MQTKLTLRLDKDLIEQAKVHAKKEGKSLSKTVADYFQLLSEHADKTNSLPPITRSLIGILNAKTIDEEDCKKQLLKKYL